ncbi:hypothetical protein DUI87_10518 [Hirundo rustica rustica]|uniref:SMB domain-containing protein n=1 Tax=Hirundo rustica rustica TaxID=333673 RepID=A0A3M0KIC4_HIRRU|nr:hypothetical protein DUI87_10518 [Hirundo rustica rustica]
MITALVLLAILLLILAGMPLAFLATWTHAGSYPAAVDQHPKVLFCRATFQPRESLRPGSLCQHANTAGEAEEGRRHRREADLDKMELGDGITKNYRGYSEEMSLQPEEYVKKKTVLKYKVICAVLLCALVVVSLGLGLGLGLNRGIQEQVSCRHKCNEPHGKGVPGCQCDSGCKERQDCCWDYEDTCVTPNLFGKMEGETSWVEEPCVSMETPQCPAGFTLPPLILFSMDGFRAEYLETWGPLLPNIEKFKTCGTHSKYMRAVYPTKTFPNHYTIVTGLYPESHGIIDNNMYDVHLNAHFSLSGEEKFKPAWWKGQPVWLTAMEQKLKAGTYFWPGSDVPIGGTFPTLYVVYNGSIPYEKRISGILEWLDKAQPERPDIYTLYIEQPDSSGHSFGPVSAGVIKALQAADQALGMLMDGLKQRNLHKCVNLIVLADHGMEKTYCKQLEYMTNYFKKVNFYMYGGPAARIRALNVPEDYFTFDSEGIVKNLTCRRSPQHFKPYLTPDLPKRFHYANNIRIDKVHLLVDRQWLAVRNEGYKSCDGGNHGYNNEFKSMEISNESDVKLLNQRLNLTMEENYNSSDLEQYDALLTSNIVPMYKAFKEIWDYFHDVLLQKYARERNGVNVISGPVFDYNYDGHFDRRDEIKQYVNNTKIPVPTHYYVVLTSCNNTSYTPLNCSGPLNALSFIIPHRPDNTESCAENKTLSEWVEERVQAHAARVRDVELLTGLDFYQERNESVSEILRLKTFLPIFEAESN